jgi:hypothetical protein
MIDIGSKASQNRRRFAFAFLAIGAAGVALTLGKDYPRAQPIVFRIDDTRESALSATFTRVGEAEARTGFTLTLKAHHMRDVPHTVHLPDGDYIVTIELRDAGDRDGGKTLPLDSTEETTVTRRVSLSGSEVVVPVPSKASE